MTFVYLHFLILHFQELATAVSALHATSNQPQVQPQATSSNGLSIQQQQTQQQQQQQQVVTNGRKMVPPKLQTGLTPRTQRRQLVLDISQVSESPSRDELLCLESLEQQLRS